MNNLTFTPALDCRHRGECRIRLSDPKLPPAIRDRLGSIDKVRFEPGVLTEVFADGDNENYATTPSFFEWQRLQIYYEAEDDTLLKPPYFLYINGIKQTEIASAQVMGKHKLSSSFTLGNSVGYSDLAIKDSANIALFSLGMEVFPQKLDYRDDFKSMMGEITEILYTLAFDHLKKTYSFVSPRTSYHQNLAEWLALFTVLAKSFEQSIDMILRNPKSRIAQEQHIRPVDKIRQIDRSAIKWAVKHNQYHTRPGQGLALAAGLSVSHLPEKKKRVTFDTFENRFAKWAIEQSIRKLGELRSALSEIYGDDSIAELDMLRKYSDHLRFRLRDSVFSEVGGFDNRMHFSTTLTMSPGYKDFYYRFLLLRKGLEMHDSDLFRLDFKDIATLYEYWCFLKTVKILKEDPKYDLVSNDLVKVEHHRFSTNLRQGNSSKVEFRQTRTGQDIALYFNRSFPTKTYSQRPDNFIEFSREGYGNSNDKKPFKYVFDAKYRFDRGSENYPATSVPYGPPQDTIGQLHRYRDAILWNEQEDASYRTAIKSIGGLILFPYPDDEREFVQHPYYKSLESVNVGAVPLQPGRSRENKLYKKFLDSLLGSSGEDIQESIIRENFSEYDATKGALAESVLIGLVPRANSAERRDFHFGRNIFYTQWSKNPLCKLENIKYVAIYEQSSGHVVGYGQVLEVEPMIGSQLHTIGVTWNSRSPDTIHIVYRLGEIIPCSLKLTSFPRTGRRYSNYMALEMALGEDEEALLSLNDWQQLKDWRQCLSAGGRPTISRSPEYDQEGNDISLVQISCLDGSRKQ